MTFQGIEAKGQYSGTAIEDILPVTYRGGTIASNPPRASRRRSSRPLTRSSRASARHGRTCSASTG